VEGLTREKLIKDIEKNPILADYIERIEGWDHRFTELIADIKYCMETFFNMESEEQREGTKAQYLQAKKIVKKWNTRA
jgi:hypothetical protein